MNSVYTYLNNAQIEALRRATSCGFAPPRDCMANRIDWAYNEDVVNEMTEKAYTDGLFGEQIFIQQQEALVAELSQRIYDLQNVISSFREQVDELNLTIDAAKMLAASMDLDVIQKVSDVRKEDLSAAEYIYYVAIISHYDYRKAPIAAALYKMELGNLSNIRFVKDLIEVEYEERNTLADRLAEHPEIKARGINQVIFASGMGNRISQKPFKKHFEVVEYVEEIC